MVEITGDSNSAAVILAKIRPEDLVLAVEPTKRPEIHHIEWISIGIKALNFIAWVWLLPMSLSLNWGMIVIVKWVLFESYGCWRRAGLQRIPSNNRATSFEQIQKLWTNQMQTTMRNKLQKKIMHNNNSIAVDPLAEGLKQSKYQNNRKLFNYLLLHGWRMSLGSDINQHPGRSMYLWNVCIQQWTKVTPVFHTGRSKEKSKTTEKEKNYQWLEAISWYCPSFGETPTVQYCCTRIMKPNLLYCTSLNF